MVVGLIAGGQDAVTNAQEGAEDRADDGAADLRNIDLNSRDVVVGIAVSGRTPYVVGALDFACRTGSKTVAVTCNPASVIAKSADISIAPVVGPEVLTGSTRLKSGTAQKLVLNMLSTASMVRIGKTYQNLMVRHDRQQREARGAGGISSAEATGCTPLKMARICARQRPAGTPSSAILVVLTGKPARRGRDGKTSRTPWRLPAARARRRENKPSQLVRWKMRHRLRPGQRETPRPTNSPSPNQLSSRRRRCVSGDLHGGIARRSTGRRQTAAPAGDCRDSTTKAFGGARGPANPDSLPGRAR